MSTYIHTDTRLTEKIEAIAYKLAQELPNPNHNHIWGPSGRYVGFGLVLKKSSKGFCCWKTT